MDKTSKSVSLDNKIIESLKKDGEEFGRNFSDEVNFACRKYLESKK